MSYLHGTPRFNLPQTIGTDVREWFDTNDAFAAVDKALGDVIDESASNVTRITQAENDIVSHNTRITTLEGEMDVAQADIDTLEANVAQLISDTGDSLQDIRDMIDPDEEPTATASHSYRVGERFIYNDTWYRCTVAIAAGATIVPNVNCTSINVDSELRALQALIPSSSTVDELVQDVEQLQTDVSTAQSTATSAGTAAANAQTTANSAQSTANSANTQATTNKNAIGTLSSLQTTNKSNLVAAVNEVLGKVANVGIKSVQRGSTTVQTDGTTHNVTISAVTTSKSFVTSSARIQSGGGGFSHSGTIMNGYTARLTSATNLEIIGGLNGNNSTANIVVDWEVIESN